MDKLMDFAKDRLGEQLSGSDKAHKDPLPSGNKTHGGAYPPSFTYDPDDDDDEKTAKKASDHAGPSGSSALFASVLGAIGQKKTRIQEDQDSDIDEEYAVKKHQRNFKDDGEDDGDGDGDSENDDKSLGTAAAMQALKLFTQGQSQEKQSQSAFMAVAMAEATKLFDDKAAKGKVSETASKESTVQKAGEMALKMYLQSQGKQKGGSSGFLSLASKFM